MLIIPIDQTQAGNGNTVLKGDEVTVTDKSSLHFAYQNTDGTVYTGANDVTLKINASNEPVLLKDDINFPVVILTVILNSSNPVRLYDIDGTYRNIIITVESITDGKVTAFHFPKPLNDNWR